MTSSRTEQPNIPDGHKEGLPSAEVSPPATTPKRLPLLRLLLVRARFILLFVVTGAVFVYWDTVANYYAKWTRPAAEMAGGADFEFYCPMHPQVVRDEMGTCPICLMPLSKRKKAG